MRYLYENNKEIVEHVIDRFSHITLMRSDVGGDIIFDLLDNRTDGGLGISCYFPKEPHNKLSIVFNGERIDENTGGFENKHEYDNDDWFNIQIGGDEDPFADAILHPMLIGDKSVLAIRQDDFQTLIDAIMDRITRRFFEDCMGD